MVDVAGIEPATPCLQRIGCLHSAALLCATMGFYLSPAL